MSDGMSDSDINQWARTFMETHKNPIKKLELSGTKFFLPSGTGEENELVNKSLNSLAKALKTQRVERRCARSTASWLSEQKLVEITKGGGILNNFGFANKHGKFLYPEEVLFLLETNRLELFWNKVPMSIQQAYEVILNKAECSLPKYLTYKKLAHQGFRVLRTGHTQVEEHKPKLKKRTLFEREQGASLQDDSNVTRKKLILSDRPEDNRSCNKTKQTSNEIHCMAQDIFNRLREIGPKKFEIGQNQDGDYKMFLSNNTSKTNPDFNLHVCESKFVDPSLGFLKGKVISGYAAAEFSGYFSYESINLPNL